MRIIFSLLPFMLMASCEQTENDMSALNLPATWTAGDYVPESQVYSDPPECCDSSRIHIYGMRDGDSEHRVYTIPANTPIADVVREFAVGSHAEISYGDVAAETIALVAVKANKIAEIIPCHVVFADAAGLKLRFERQVTDEDLEGLLELFPMDVGFQAGAEGYIIEIEEGRHLFERVKEENLFHFWWD